MELSGFADVRWNSSNEFAHDIVLDYSNPVGKP